LNLGLTKSNTSLVWVAGPLSGLIVQPIIGVIADQNKSRWGRRRPFIVMGSIIVAFSLLTLGFTKEIVGIFIPDEEKSRTIVIVLAVLSIYAVDFAINAGMLSPQPQLPRTWLTSRLPVMSCARSLVVDTLPIEKQQAGAAWCEYLPRQFVWKPPTDSEQPAGCPPSAI
jgi:solute carrier family 45 protein 1/2/4